MRKEVLRFLNEGRHLNELVAGRPTLRLYLEHQLEHEAQVVGVVARNPLIGTFEDLLI